MWRVHELLTKNVIARFPARADLLARPPHLIRMADAAKVSLAVGNPLRRALCRSLVSPDCCIAVEMVNRARTPQRKLIICMFQRIQSIARIAAALLSAVLLRR
jgi:hypothetical protein